MIIILLPSSESYASLLFFFFNDPPTTEIYTLSLHDALPILGLRRGQHGLRQHLMVGQHGGHHRRELPDQDRKSTRLNSSHANISYAVFCLKKKKIKKTKKT